MIGHKFPWWMMDLTNVSRLEKHTTRKTFPCSLKTGRSTKSTQAHLHGLIQVPRNTRNRAHSKTPLGSSGSSSPYPTPRRRALLPCRPGGGMGYTLDDLTSRKLTSLGARDGSNTWCCDMELRCPIKYVFMTIGLFLFCYWGFPYCSSKKQTIRPSSLAWRH